MRTKKILSIVLAMVLLVSAVPLAVMPAAAYETKIPFAGENDELTKEELVSAILPYMLEEEGAYILDDVGDAAYVYAYWDGKAMMITDQVDRTVTFYRPIERIVTTWLPIERVLVELGGLDKMVGVSTTYSGYTEDVIILLAYPQLKELPGVGRSGQENLELMVSLKPDAIISSRSPDVIQDKTGISTVSLSTSYYSYETTFERYELASKIIGAEERCEELISFKDEEIDKITEVTSEIPDSERVSVLLVFWSMITKAQRTLDSPIEMAGGINVAKEVLPTKPGSSVVDVTKEQVIKWNPDIILIHRYQTKEKHGSWAGGLTIEDVLSDPDLQSITAVKNGTVYYIRDGYCGCSPSTGIAESFYLAKLFYPDKFKDLDVEEEGNMILERFYGVDGLYTWMEVHCGLYNWE